MLNPLPAGMAAKLATDPRFLLQLKQVHKYVETQKENLGT